MDELRPKVSWTSFGAPRSLLAIPAAVGDEAAPGADEGKRGLGLPLPNGAGTGPVAEISCPRQPCWVYPSPPSYNPVGGSTPATGCGCQRLRMRRISYVDGQTAAVLARRGGSFEVVDEMLAGKRLSNPRR